MNKYLLPLNSIQVCHWGAKTLSDFVHLKTQTKAQTQTKAKTKCSKDPTYAIFEKKWFMDIIYDNMSANQTGPDRLCGLF